MFYHRCLLFQLKCLLFQLKYLQFHLVYNEDKQCNHYFFEVLQLLTYLLQFPPQVPQQQVEAVGTVARLHCHCHQL